MLSLVSLAGQDGARHLITHLVNSAEPPNFLRIVDRYFIIPSANPIPSTTYLDADTRAALNKGAAAGYLEYLQGNLLTEGESHLVLCRCQVGGIMTYSGRGGGGARAQLR